MTDYTWQWTVLECVKVLAVAYIIGKIATLLLVRRVTK